VKATAPVEETKDNQQLEVEDQSGDTPRKMKGPRPKGLKKFKPVMQ
jgi:hypothetical protein